ncbi:MAG: MrtC family glutamic-type intramembrane protease [Polyangiales bacterium]|jgi:membrane protease YdiL (CAAX protease family)
MAPARAALRRILWVYALVCASVFAATRLESIAVVGQYVHLVVAAIFLLTAIRLTRSDPSHFGMALGGLLEPPEDDRGAGPLGIFDLGRAIHGALPSAAVELGVALGIAAVVFPIFTLGFYWWNQPAGIFTLTLPPNATSFVLAQLIVVALPEEAFFRGYLQTALSDLEETRLRVLGVRLAPRAWILQAILFAAIHFIVDPHPARLAVFFPALLFGWTRGWRGGIGAALALHAMSNLYSEILARSWL